MYTTTCAYFYVLLYHFQVFSWMGAAEGQFPPSRGPNPYYDDDSLTGQAVEYYLQQQVIGWNLALIIVGSLLLKAVYTGASYSTAVDDARDVRTPASRRALATGYKRKYGLRFYLSAYPALNP
jgi:hypothetical protein